MDSPTQKLGWRGAVLALAFLPMACGTADVTAGKLADRLIGAPKPDPAATRLPPGGGLDRTASARPNQRLEDMREMPELLAETAQVVWDGRPTLPGLWLAHPDVQQAHHVRIRNSRSGTVIDAALLPWRSGATAAGPVLSAETADALGLFPGIPATLSLVAIARVDEPNPEPTLAAQGEARLTEDDVAGETATALLDGIPLPTTLGAADRAVEDEPSERAVAATARPVEGPAGIAELGFVEGSLLDGGSAIPDGAAPAEQPQALPAETIETDDLAAVQSTAAPEAEAPVPTAEPSPPAIRPEPTPAPRQSASPTADPAAPIQAAPAPEIAATTADPVEAPSPGDAAQEQGGPITDGQRYVQAGYFTNPEHAADLIRTLYGYGIRARNLETSVRGVTMKRVLAGPFDTVEARDEALDRLRDIGVPDARPSPG